jgi:hypothetical protein
MGYIVAFVVNIRSASHPYHTHVVHRIFLLLKEFSVPLRKLRKLIIIRSQIYFFILTSPSHFNDVFFTVTSYPLYFVLCVVLRNLSLRKVYSF